MVQQKRIGFLAAALVVGALAFPAIGQPQPGQPAQPAQPGQPGGNGGRAGFQQRMNDMLKTQLGLNDDEFKAIQPKLEAVTTAQRATRGGGRGGFGGAAGGGRRGQNGNNGGTPAAADPNAPAPTATEKASTDLKTVLDNKDASADEIKAKLAALRDARNAAKGELTKAQGELKELLTQRQEAVLVNMGILD